MRRLSITEETDFYWAFTQQGPFEEVQLAFSSIATTSYSNGERTTNHSFGIKTPRRCQP